MSFDGAKIALVVRGALVVILRDNIPTIPWPGYWDFPGGGREGDETPLACALRELAEELHHDLDPAQVIWSMHDVNDSGRPVWFFVAVDDTLDLADLSLGDEGQEFRTMAVADYLAHPRAIPKLVERLQAWLSVQAEARAL
ncbi:MAG: NUDIX hydrolase [Deltaproteobacteria bacterium]